MILDGTEEFAAVLHRNSMDNVGCVGKSRGWISGGPYGRWEDNVRHVPRMPAVAVDGIGHFLTPDQEGSGNPFSSTHCR